MSDKQDPREADVALFEELSSQHPSVERSDLARMLMLMRDGALKAVKQHIFAQRDPEPGEKIDLRSVTNLMRERLIGLTTEQLSEQISHLLAAGEAGSLDDEVLTRLIEERESELGAYLAEKQ